MKKTITILSAALTLVFSRLNAQTVVSDFENFTLPADSFYYSNTGADWSATTADFRYKWNSSFSYWSDGSAYTNKRDTVNAYPNIYSCRPKFGYNNSNNYVTVQNNAIIALKSPYNRVDGFYITNTNYAFKSMKNGDSFAKKFGGTSGNDPDWFKLTVKGYLNGSLINDSVEFYLADYRFTNNAQDYIVNNWQYVNTSTLGKVDSVTFFMYSSDVGSFGINTPLYFSIDDFSASVQPVGIKENQLKQNLSLYPNPFNSELNIKLENGFEANTKVTIEDLTGKVITVKEISAAKTHLNLSFLEKGVYFITFENNNERYTQKLIKQ